jgi:hypothetical protein
MAAAGSPVQFVSVPDVGVPKTGVTKVGEVENTKLVEVVPVAPDAVYPVMLLNAVIDAEVALVPPLATDTGTETVDCENAEFAILDNGYVTDRR